jgi:hypothetical protein
MQIKAPDDLLCFPEAAFSGRPTLTLHDASLSLFVGSIAIPIVGLASYRHGRKHR